MSLASSDGGIDATVASHTAVLPSRDRATCDGEDAIFNRMHVDAVAQKMESSKPRIATCSRWSKVRRVLPLSTLDNSPNNSTALANSDRFGCRDEHGMYTVTTLVVLFRFSQVLRPIGDYASFQFLTL